jgi:hypothetical protein
MAASMHPQRALQPQAAGTSAPIVEICPGLFSTIDNRQSTIDIEWHRSAALGCHAVVAEHQSHRSG